MENQHFKMPVNEVFHISGRGYMFLGCIESGTVDLSDEVVLNNGLKSFVNGIETDKQVIEKFFNITTEGEIVGLLLGSIAPKSLTDFDNLVIESIDTERNHCEISVTEQSPLKGKGIIVKGKILSGTLNVGDPIIYAQPSDGILQTATVDAIETDGNSVATASQGQIVALNFKGLTMRAKFDKVIKR
jgi:translation elongation factor EF-1alpha